MALVSCPDCNREVSTRAHHCVHCGRPWPGRTCGMACVLAVAAVVALCVFGGWFVMRARMCEKSDAAIRKCRVAEEFKRLVAPAEAPAAAPAPAVETAPAVPKEE